MLTVPNVQKFGFLAPLLIQGNNGAPLQTLVPAEENIAFEDRSYLKIFERSWGAPSSGRSMLTLSPTDGLTDIWSNAYPNAAPQLSDDGELLIYLSDMGSEDIADTGVCIAIRDGTGAFSAEGTEIDPSDYPDSAPSLVGTKDRATAVWVRSFVHQTGEAGGLASAADVVNALAASEVMAGIYKDGEFTTTRLTDNDHPDLAPKVASAGDKSIAVWRSVTLGDMDNPLAFTGDYLMYALYDGTYWSEAKCLYDGSVDRVSVLNTAMLKDGTAAVTYQVAEAAGGTAIMCALISLYGEVIQSIRLTAKTTETLNPQITTVKFPDGHERFLVGWNAVAENGGTILQLAALNKDGSLYPGFSLELADLAGAAGFDNFRFIRNAANLGDVSLVWSEPEDEDKDGIYEYSIFGTKVFVPADNAVLVSGKQRLVTLAEGRQIDSFDARLEIDTGKIDFALLLTETAGSSTLATVVAEYKNGLTVREPSYEFEDLLPGTELPLNFAVKNDGIDSISKLTITLGGKDYVFNNEKILPGEEKDYLLSYTVPAPLSNTAYTVTAQFGSGGDTYTKTGSLRLAIPDAGIYRIDATKETGRERGFRVLLQNSAFADLQKDIHKVKLEIWGSDNFTEGSPLKSLTITDDQLEILNGSLLSLDITLGEDDLRPLFDEKGEIPQGGIWLIFKTEIRENGQIIEDADISNDIYIINIRSLQDKKGEAVSLASLMETADGCTTVKAEAFNNSMQTITNGQVIVTLRDKEGRALATETAHDLTDSNSLLVIPGEEAKTVGVTFACAGTGADVTFARIAEDSNLLAALNLTGVPLKFNKDTFDYNVETQDLKQTVLTAVAENPAAVITVSKDGASQEIANPIPLAYGTNILAIKVAYGGAVTTYKVTVNNKKNAADTGTGGDEVSSGGSDPVNSFAGLVIDGIKQQELAIDIRDAQATVRAGSLAQLLFTRDMVLKVPTIPGVSSYCIEMPADTLKNSRGPGTLTISTGLGEITINPGMLAEIPGSTGKKVTITISRGDKDELPAEIRTELGEHPLLKLSVSLDGTLLTWNNPASPVNVRIPYFPTENELANMEHIVAWYIDGAGGISQVPGSRYDRGTGQVVFSTSHFSQFAVAFDPVLRLAGKDRIETALQIVQATYPAKIEKAILATANNYPDALAGSTLAAKLNAPIILVGEAEADQEKVLAYLKANLNSGGEIYILGGTGVINSGFGDKLKDRGIQNINRLAGSDRYETALKIAEQLDTKVGSSMFLVSGENYPDALSISSIAAQKGLPVFLTPKDKLNAALIREITALKPAKVYIIGLQGAINSIVEDQIAEITGLSGEDIIRIGGVDRCATSLAIAHYFNPDNQTVCIATGKDFPDALAGGVYAAGKKAPIILAGGNLSTETLDYISSKRLSEIIIFGGEAVINTDVERLIRKILNQK